MALSNATLTAALQATLKTAADLPAYWTEIIDWANRRAQAEIGQALANLGYPPGTAAGWDDFDVYNESLGLYWCGIRGRALVSKDQAAALEALDCRKMLADLSDIRIGGVVVLPVPTVLRVRHGNFVVPTTRPHNPLEYSTRTGRRRLNP